MPSTDSDLSVPSQMARPVSPPAPFGKPPGRNVNERWVARLGRKEKIAYFEFLKNLRIQNPENEFRIRGNKRYYRYARDVFLQGQSTLDNYTCPQNQNTKASMGPRG